MSTIACLIAISLNNIGDAMALVGSTINPIIGFILPVVFYWRVMKEKGSKNKLDQVAIVLTVIVIVIASIASFVSTI